MTTARDLTLVVLGLSAERPVAQVPCPWRWRAPR
jgi:hypothetical protein